MSKYSGKQPIPNPLTVLVIILLVNGHATASARQQQQQSHHHAKGQRRPESSSSLFAEVEDLNDSSIKTRYGRINIEHLGDSPNDFDQLIKKIIADAPRKTNASPGNHIETTNGRGQVKQQQQQQQQPQAKVSINADVNNKTTMQFFRNNKTFASIVFTNSVQENQRQPRRLINCHLIDLEKHSSDVVLYEAKYGIRTIGVEFKEMMQLIEACTNIARLRRKPIGSSSNSTGGVREAIQEISSYDSSDLLSIWRGILPGTNWCGMGDRATSYNDLGFESDIDICCRAHDFCPIRLSAFSSGYGLFNWSFYTRSHCWCDQNFLDCLRQAESPLSTVVMKFYFNIMKTTCLNDNETANALEQRDSVAIKPLFGQRQQPTSPIVSALTTGPNRKQLQLRYEQQSPQQQILNRFAIPALKRSQEFHRREETVQKRQNG